VSVGAGTDFTLVVDSAGVLWATGNGWYDVQVANLTLARKIGAGYVSVAAGKTVAYLLKSDGTLWSLGFSSDVGQLGRVAATQAEMLTPGIILSGVSQVAAGPNAGYAVKTDGTVWAWGDNSSGQLGDGTTTNRATPVQVPGSDFKSISSGSSHAVALKQDGSVWAWGSNNGGELADGTTTASATPKKVAVGAVIAVAGNGNTYVANAGGDIYAAGDNFFGQLGNGTRDGTGTPTLQFKKTLFNGSVGGTGGGTGGTGGGTGGTSGGTQAECAAEPYTGSTADPQVYTFDYIAQFDQCAWRATNNRAYITDGNNQCMVLTGLLASIGGGFTPQYCNSDGTMKQ
jgi:alpha-tubulin suppressor-like RCC1 family protein